MAPTLSSLCANLKEQKKLIFIILSFYVILVYFWNAKKLQKASSGKSAEKTWMFYQKRVGKWENEQVNTNESRRGNEFVWDSYHAASEDQNLQNSFGLNTSDYDVHLEFYGNVDRIANTEINKNISNATEFTNKINNRNFNFSFTETQSEFAGLLLSETTDRLTPGVLNVAIGGGLTSAKLLNLSESNLGQKMQLFHTFLPSFCKTVAVNYSTNMTTTTVSNFIPHFKYNYHFYFAYDSNDEVLDDLARKGSFYRAFKTSIDKDCPKGLVVHLHFVQCDHTRLPTWAQNDAMIEAYLDNMDYFYRINDDTNMKTSNWTEQFVEVLAGYDPPNVGVVGPTHSGGNTGILTYDFVHKTHLEIFGFYYPRLFTDWWGDDWITKIYRPDRSTKLNKVFLQHTLAMGQRYSVRDWGVSKKLEDQLERDRVILKRYIRSVRRKSQNQLKPDGTRVISMSLFGSNPRYTWGAIRNAQLARILFPKWKLRFYVSRSSIEPDTSVTHTNEDLDLHDHRPTNVTSLKVSRRLLKRLKLLGAEIKFVKHEKIRDIKPEKWRNLAIMDDKVEWLLVRNVDSRLTETESITVEKWIDNCIKRISTVESSFLSLTTLINFFSSLLTFNSKSNTYPAFIHVIRDSANLTENLFPKSMWGGNVRILRIVLDQSLRFALKKDLDFNNQNLNTYQNLKSKMKHLKINNPYLSPGIEDLFEINSQAIVYQNKTLTTHLLIQLNKLLKVDFLDSITCLRDIETSDMELHFAGQRFDEHELPYLNNDNVSIRNSYDNIEKVMPSKLCRNRITTKATTTTSTIQSTSTKSTVAPTLKSTTVTTPRIDRPFNTTISRSGFSNSVAAS